MKKSQGNGVMHCEGCPLKCPVFPVPPEQYEQIRRQVRNSIDRRVIELGNKFLRGEVHPVFCINRGETILIEMVVR